MIQTQETGQIRENFTFSMAMRIPNCSYDQCSAADGVAEKAVRGSDTTL
jgi:hypothetical protein